MRAAIIGVGKAGSLHLKTLKKIDAIKKIYLIDRQPEKLSTLKGETILSDYTRLKDNLDLAIVATPTSTHYNIARFFLNKGVPVLVEKPLTSALGEADSLIRIAQKRKVLLFVGHIERYNNAYIHAKKIIKNPQFIECHRLSMYPHRSLDISVVLDLMIHDLDIILDITKDTVKKIEAVGVKVLSKHPDIANARISFKKGCIANVTASRISKEKVRKFRVFSPHSYLSLDYAQQKVEIYRKFKTLVQRQMLEVPKEEPFKKELLEFIFLIQKNILSLSSSLKARDALSLALKIQKLIEKN